MKSYFITATDTNVGKTITTMVLGMLVQAKGLKAGVLKPVQCAGNDAAFLKKKLNLKDPLHLVNPIFAQEPLSPHLALRRAGKRFDMAKVKRAHAILSKRYDLLFIEGAGGLMVPLRDDYFNADLAKALGAGLIIVSRLGLGTINHTLLTINQAKAYGLKIKGIIFSDSDGRRKAVADKTNPDEIARISGVKVLGIIPYLKTKTRKEALSLCHGIRLD